jgi:hypothetical protein
MALLNFGLLNTNLPAEIAGSVQRGQDEALRSQMAQQQFKTGAMQQESAQMQLEQAKRDRDSLAKMQEAFVANGKSPDLEANFDEMIKSGIAHYVDIGIKGKQKLMEQKQFANIMGGGPVAALAATAPTAPMNALAATTPTAPAAPVNALAAPATGPDVTDLRRKRDMLLSMGTTQSIAAARAIDADIALAAREPVYHNVTGVGLVDPRTGRVVTPAVEAAPSEVKEYEYAKKQGYRGSLFDFKREMALAGRAPAQPSAPVAVVDPATGKQIYVSREEALRNKMTPAAAMESLPPKEIQKREAALPQATSAIKGFESKSDSFVNDLVKLRDHPGLNQITGIAAGRLPAISAEGRAAEALYDKVVAKGGFQALQDLRDASKTGGALGNVSNQEGKQLTASFSAINRVQDAKDVKAAIDQAIADVQGAKTRMREAYDSTYSYKSGAPVAAPVAPNLDALLNKYK